MSILLPLFLLALPWLNPFTFGPAPAVIPWVFSLACFGVVVCARAAAADSLHGQVCVRAIAGAWLAAALISAAIGLVQYFGASLALAPWVNSTGLGEAYGNLRQRNQFATLVAMGLAALSWWVAQGLSWRLAAGAAIVLALGSVASSSRTGLLQWLLYIGCATLWSGERRASVQRVLLVAVLAYAVATLALPLLAGLDPLSNSAWGRLQSGDEACTGRTTLWANVLHLIAQKPILGWGWGELGYAHFVTLYPGARFCDILDNAHNLPLHIAVELGVPAALALVSAVLWIVCRAEPWKEKHPTRQLAWAVAALIGFHSLLEYPLWYGPFQAAAALCAWLLWRTRGAVGTAWKPNSLPLAPVLSGGFAIIFAATLVFVAWDYWRVSQLYIAPDERASTYRDNTLSKVQDSWLFRSQVQFAELTTMQLTPANSARALDLSQQLLHFSSEPRVVEKLIESATMLGRDDVAAFYMLRYKAAFPKAYEQWSGNARELGSP